MSQLVAELVETMGPAPISLLDLVDESVLEIVYGR